MAIDDEAERGRAEPIDVDYEPAYREERRGLGMGGAVALALIAGGVGAAGGAVAPRVNSVDAALDRAFPASADAQGTAPAAQSNAELDQRLDAIEALINAPIATSAADGAADPTAARVFALQASLRDVETRLGQMPSSAEVSALVAEVRRLQEELPSVAAEARSAATAARASYAVVAASEAARASGPFEQAHSALAALLPNDPNVAALAPLARTGAPTRGELRERFVRLDNEIIRAANQAQAGAGFWGRIQAALLQWIVIRRAGGGDTPEGMVERAEQYLARRFELAGLRRDQAERQGFLSAPDAGALAGFADAAGRIHQEHDKPQQWQRDGDHQNDEQEPEQSCRLDFSPSPLHLDRAGISADDLP